MEQYPNDKHQDGGEDEGELGEFGKEGGEYDCSYVIYNGCIHETIRMYSFSWDSE